MNFNSPEGERLIGFENAHPVPERRGPGLRRRRANDHWHRLRSIGSYGYKDAATLLEEFWKEVDEVLKERVSIARAIFLSVRLI